MKKGFLLVLALAFAGTLFASAFASPAEYEVKGKAGEYNVTVKMEGNPPAEGKNNMTIVITDHLSRPVTDAQVLVHYLMPSLPGRRPMMEYSVKALPEGALYRARLNLSMSGQWAAEIEITRAGKTDSMKFGFMVP